MRFLLIIASLVLCGCSELPETAEVKALILGIQQGETGDYSGSIPYFIQATKINPYFFEAYANLGLAYAMIGDYENSKRSLMDAIKVRATGNGVFLNLGNVLKHLDENNTTFVRCYVAALRLKPDDIDTITNIAGFANRQRKYEFARRLAERALRLSSEKNDEAQFALEIAIRHTCDWYNPLSKPETIAPIIEQAIVTNDIERQKVLWSGMTALYIDLPPHLLLEAAKGFTRGVKSKMTAIVNKSKIFQPMIAALLPRNRMRIIYLGQDFGDHPMSHMMQGIFRLHDRNKFEISCFATNKDDGTETRTLMTELCGDFTDVSQLNDADAAVLINKKQAHILVNLFGQLDREKNVIVAHNPSPIQINHRWCSTTGSDSTHYHVTDRIASPPELSSLYSEPLAFLPNSYLPNDHAYSYAEAGKLSREAKKSMRNDDAERKMVLASFNNVYKLGKEQFESWVRVLKHANNNNNNNHDDNNHAELWMLPNFIAGTHAGRRLQFYGQKMGLAPGAIKIVDFWKKDKHIERASQVDLFLDTWFINAHSTAVDVLWGGVVTLTLPQWRMASRVGSSVVIAANCSHYVARNKQDYEDIAMKLTSSRKKLQNFEDCIVDAANSKSCPLFDTPVFVRHMEKLYKMFWDIHVVNDKNKNRLPNVILAK